MFSDCVNLSDVTELVFSEEGAPGNAFLVNAFYGCVSLTSPPRNFMAGLSGQQGDSFLRFAFARCYGLNYIDIFSDGSAVSGGSEFMYSAMSDNVARDASPKLTLRIHGTTMLSPVTDSCGLTDANVLEIQVAPALLQAYKEAPAWSVISDSKFAALH